METTDDILAQHAAILDNLAAGQAAISQTLQALVGVVERQQVEGSRTSDTLLQLAAGVKAAQDRSEARRKQFEAERAVALERMGVKRP